MSSFCRLKKYIKRPRPELCVSSPRVHSLASLSHILLVCPLILFLGLMHFLTSSVWRTVFLVGTWIEVPHFPALLRE